MLTLPQLSEAWLTRVDAVSRALLGVSDLRGPKLAAALARVSHAYTEERAGLGELRGDDDALCARLKFFSQRDLLKVHGPLAELHALRALPPTAAWRVLDLGAGLGATSLGVARFAALTGTAERLQVTAVDVDPEALAIYRELARDVSTLPGVPIELREVTADLRQPLASLTTKLSAPYDMIVLGLALNELRTHELSEDATADTAAEYLRSLAELLAPGGVLLVLEPALRETSRFLHAVRDRLAARAAAPYVFAPCTRSASCPMLARERDYCHERVPHPLPPRLAELAQQAGLRESDLTYSYLTLHASPRSLRELQAGQTGALYRAVSAPLPSKGKLELWLCGETGAPRAMRLDRHESAANAALAEAGRGAVVNIPAVQPTALGGNNIPAVQPQLPAERLRIGAGTRIELPLRWKREG